SLSLHSTLNKQRKDDPDHVRDFQHACYVCCHPGGAFALCFRPYYWSSARLRRWCHSHCAHL
uniref:Actin n=1 Tax=Parascaris univalens TaxID=6257 RepID=A0A915CFI7_PARUN